MAEQKDTKKEPAPNTTIDIPGLVKIGFKKPSSTTDKFLLERWRKREERIQNRRLT